ncbi:MAG TPA: hypothetical protein VKS43_08745 [Burkholderiales bacterium]|nr:hypothetical protein [Burkholderiales bacterium]
MLILSLAALGWVSAASIDKVGPPSSIAEYVFLHETRSQGIPLQIAARASMCSGKIGGARN